jgi:hypothetical protein
MTRNTAEYLDPRVFSRKTKEVVFVETIKNG